MQIIKKLLIATALLFAGGTFSSVWACLPICPLPEDYYVYRISENYLRVVDPDPAHLPGSDENCALWMQQLNARDIDTLDVYRIVYKEDLNDIKTLCASSAFAALLARNPEALKVLRLAKDCEKARFAVTTDPWYYPVKDDSEHVNLEQIVARARECTSELFRSRYFLQEIRALFTLGRYQEILSRWTEMKDTLPDDILKELTLRYIAGAYYNIGEVEKAVGMFLEQGDVYSAISCSHIQDKETLEATVDVDVNYKGLRPMLENEIQHLCYSVYYGEKDWRVRFEEIRDLCDVALAKNPRDKALWYYTAAYIDYYNKKYDSALALLKNARKTVDEKDILAESIRVLGIMLDARTSTHNKAYERRLLKDLQWLDSRIVSDLTDEVRERTADDNGWMMRTNHSYYYWNDMMRMLTVGILAPAYLKEGNYVRAMQLANMADNRLTDMTGVVQYIFREEGPNEKVHITTEEMRQDPDRWKPDYSNNFFMIADSLGADKLAAYRARIAKPENELDRFANSRGYVAADYLDDLAGTLLIRERRYEEAVSYLEKLPVDFQKRLNTSDYLNDEIPGGAKLKYARDMVELGRLMKDKSDPRRAAEARWNYGTNLMMQYMMRWALSYYFKFTYTYDYVQEINENGMKLASGIIRDAMLQMPDREYAAKMQYAMCNYKTVVEKYDGTEAAGWVRAHCDTWEDYHREMPKHWEHE